MTERNPLKVIRNVMHEAGKSEDSKHKKVESSGLDPRMAAVREWQGKRIAQTYRDFTAQPQYADVMRFFLEDLYAARDFSQRDHDAQRAHAFLSKFVPAEMLRLMTDAIELTELSNTLDADLARILFEDLKFKGKVTPELYAEAYRRADAYAGRQRQIELLVNVMGDAAKTARMLLTGPALRMAKGPAHAAGWTEMFEFLERGHHAFGKVKKPEAFLEAIEERETKIMQGIARGDKDPFRT